MKTGRKRTKHTIKLEIEVKLGSNVVRTEEFAWLYCMCLYLFNADPAELPSGKKKPNFYSNPIIYLALEPPTKLPIPTTEPQRDQFFNNGASGEIRTPEADY